MNAAKKKQIDALWTAAEAVAATHGRSTADWHAKGISIDSRTVQPGDLFIALIGPNFDGHAFVAEAFNKGAVAAMTRADFTGAPGAQGADAPGPLLLVEDTLAALWGLGAAARARSKARFLGVTGSVGKTSTKEALALALSAQAPTAWSAGSFNNHWGLPLSMARMARDAVYGVFELGMNHPGEIRHLTALLRPNVAMITNIEPVHIGLLGSLEAIADAKGEIFESMDESGVAVLNRDNAFFRHLDRIAREQDIKRVLSFGQSPDADVRLIECTLQATSSDVIADVAGKRLSYILPVPGLHVVLNSLGVLAATMAIGADPAASAQALGALRSIKGRGARQRIDMPRGAFDLIDDAYNANPSSMRAAIAVLGRSKVGSGSRRIAVLGDMLELGPQSASLHRGLAEPLREAGIDLVFTCGPSMAALVDALPEGMRGGHAVDSRALTPVVCAAIGAGDVVMVKGSLGSRMAVVVEALAGLARALPRAANGN
ncbi:MAG TPA: UDP-N-acetylmuramoylalanyl-D-glutamyl-2,6-diaminopimelate--D-alanyl-D-alanine ligase [Kiloniellales bacterium]|jgi:UDP-N-acetylmuramoyl-tripeptide--D-alanyl-D-alanine ligase